MLECVVNVSEGRRFDVLDPFVVAAGTSFLDIHVDGDHHRAVLTLGGPDVEEAVQAIAVAAVSLLDLGGHQGVHPRLGVIDVVPFVPLSNEGTPATTGDDLSEALEARGRFAEWAAAELGVPCFLYGPERSLPDVRRRAFVDLDPDTGPRHPHPTAGACAVGARPALVAYNLWLETDDAEVARTVASAVRGPQLRTLGLAVAGTTQVSCNLVDPGSLGPAEAYQAVADAADKAGTQVARAELVGLAPRAVVEAVPAGRRQALDLDLERTVESRLAKARRRAVKKAPS